MLFNSRNKYEIDIIIIICYFNKIIVKLHERQLHNVKYITHCGDQIGTIKFFKYEINRNH